MGQGVLRPPFGQLDLTDVIEIPCNPNAVADLLEEGAALREELPGAVVLVLIRVDRAEISEAVGLHAGCTGNACKLDPATAVLKGLGIHAGKEVEIRQRIMKGRSDIRFVHSLLVQDIERFAC